MNAQISSEHTGVRGICSNQIQDAGALARKNAAGKSRRTGYKKQTHQLKTPSHNPDVPHPEISTLSINTSGTANAEKLKGLLLELSKDPEHAQFKSILRLAADQVRITAFGYNRSTTKKKIIRLLEEFHCLEIEDIADETAIDEREIRAALLELVNEGRIKHGKRRRWQEPGKHYNDIFYLAV
jgi:hypothetical protein